jgi:hypothetical protein
MPLFFFVVVSSPLTRFILVLGTVNRFVKKDLHLNKCRFGCTYLNMKYVELFALLSILADMIGMCIHCELVKNYVCQMSQPIQFTKPFGITCRWQ